MIKAADQNKIKLQIGFMRRFDESFIHAREVIDSGEIGDVVLVKSLTRGPSVPQSWMYDIDKSNGPLAEVNSHDIDTLRWFTGSEFKSIYAIGGNFRCNEAKSKFPDFYDNVILNTSFINGMQGSIDGAQGVGYGYDARVEILGTKGVIFLGQTHEQTIAVCSKQKGIVRPFMNSWRNLFKEAYLSEDIHFIECISNDETPRVTGYDGKMAVKAVRAGNLSIKENRIVQLNY
jgi:myo-inositol 2-dehydrogenase/D-chiro-inositol 1-dehydrogenase/scyllo-inositol 2-dehydrogenase (NAD+)